MVDAFNPTQFKIDLLLSEANMLISNLSNLTTEANNTKIVADELKVLLDEYKARGRMKPFFSFSIFFLISKNILAVFSTSLFSENQFFQVDFFQLQGGWNYPDNWDPKTCPDNSNTIRIIPMLSG